MNSRLNDINAAIAQREAEQAALNRKQLAQDPTFAPVEPGFFEKLPANLLAGTANVGHELLNLPSNLLNLDARALSAVAPDSMITKGVKAVADRFPRQADMDYGKALNLPNTFADRLIQGTPEIPFYLGAPEAKAPEALASVPYLGKAAGYVAKNAPQAAVAGALSDDPVKGAATMGATQAVVDALPLPFKAAGWVAEKINPQAFAKKMADTIEDTATQYEKMSKENYDKVFGKYGDKNIYKTDQAQIGEPGQRLIGDAPPGSPNIISQVLGLNKQEVRDAFDPSTYKLFKNFEKNPTLQNAKDLKSAMGAYGRRLNNMPPSALGGVIKQSLNYASDLVDQDMMHFLNRTDPKAAGDLDAANNFFRDFVAPLRQRGVDDIARGEKKWLSPQRLYNRLQSATDRTYKSGARKGEKIIPEDHMINDVLEQLGGKMDQADYLGGMANLALGHGSAAGTGLNLLANTSRKIGGIVNNPINQMIGRMLEQRLLKPNRRGISAAINQVIEESQDGS